MRKIISLSLGILLSTFVGCNGGGGEASSNGGALVPTVPAAEGPSASNAQNDEPAQVFDHNTNKFIQLNSQDAGSAGTVTFTGVSD